MTQSDGQQTQKKDTVGQRIARLMKAKGLNQSTLAKRSGIHRTEVNRIVNDRREPRQDELAWLAQTLGVTVEQVLDDVVLPEGARKTLAVFEDAARRAEAAYSERDEIAARLKVATEENAAANARWAEERAALQKELEQALAEVAKAKSEAQGFAAELALAELSMGMERSARAAEKAQHAAALRQAEAANKALQAQVKQLTEQLVAADSAKIATGVLAGLAGLFVGGGVGVAAGRDGA
jgi:transcriptional regulator with XRE-family HTH domain